MARVRRMGRLVLLFGLLLALVIPASAGPALAGRQPAAPAGGHFVPPGDDGTHGAPADTQEGEGTPAAGPDVQPPLITMWYGSPQSFGALGNPQPEINVVGNVARANTLSYRLNGGSWKQIAIGGVTASVLSHLPEGAPDPLGGLNLGVVPRGAPDLANPGSPELSASARLEYEGDFNVEILTSALQHGSNTLELEAVGDGGKDNETVILNYAKGTTWPMPYNIDWSSVTKLTDAVQVVDGEWQLEADSIRPKVTGYDRMLVLGDLGWKDYEVTVPITIHSFPHPDSGGVGIASRWRGHFQVADEQPGHGWWNIGAYAFVFNRDSSNGGRRLAMFTGHFERVDDSSGYTITEGKTYMFKLRVQTKEAGKSGFYSFKAWEPATESEPSAWLFEEQDVPPDETFSGSVGLLAHDAIASFGDVEVVPVVKVKTTVVGQGVVNVTPALTGQSDVHLFGDSVQLEAVPSLDWAFAGWSGDLDGNVNPKSVLLTGDLDVTATFVPATATRLNVSVAGAGTIGLDPPGPWYGEGQVVKLTPSAAVGWEFSGWSGPNSGEVSNNGDGTWSLTMDADKTLTGTFVKKQYALTTNISGSGSVAKNPDKTNYEHGTVVQLTPNPASGWSFTGWSGDLSGNASPANLLMDGPKTVKAHFRDNNVGPLEYKNHTIDDDLTGGTSGNNDGVANCGETVDLAVGVINQGTVTATGINAALSTDSLYVTWTGSSTSPYPDIAASATQNNTTPFGFKVANNAPNGHTINFDLGLSSTNGGLQNDTFEVVVSCAGSEGTVERQVGTGDDDAEQRLEGALHAGQVFLNGRDLELVVDEGSHQIVGIRFRNVTIPKGAAIAEAYLKFTAKAEDSGQSALIFNTQAVDDAPGFTDDCLVHLILAQEHDICGLEQCAALAGD